MDSSAKTGSGTDPLDDAVAKAQGEALTAAQKKIEELTQELEEAKGFKEAAARAQAELQNARMRMEKEAQDIRSYASESVISKLLTTIDNFRRAAEHLPEDIQGHDWVKGVLAIEQEMMRTLSSMGVSRMEALGNPVDPEKHEVLIMGPGEQGKVTEVFEDGYEMNGRVLRIAKVKAGDGSKE